MIFLHDCTRVRSLTNWRMSPTMVGITALEKKLRAVAAKLVVKGHHDFYINFFGVTKEHHIDDEILEGNFLYSH
jgi:hypothetical protein